VDGGERGGDVALAGHGVDASEQRLDGGKVVGGGGGLGHAGGVEVADLLLVGGAGGVGSLVLIEGLAENGAVPLLERAEGAPGGLVGRDGVGGEDLVAGVLMEVDAGIDRGVDLGDVDVLQLGQGGVGLGMGGLR
jgi:hypothetical protein